MEESGSCVVITVKLLEPSSCAYCRRIKRKCDQEERGQPCTNCKDNNQECILVLSNQGRRNDLVPLRAEARGSLDGMTVEVISPRLVAPPSPRLEQSLDGMTVEVISPRSKREGPAGAARFEGGGGTTWRSRIISVSNRVLIEYRSGITSGLQAQYKIKCRSGEVDCGEICIKCLSLSW